jgi:hypothetical protein
MEWNYNSWKEKCMFSDTIIPSVPLGQELQTVLNNKWHISWVCKFKFQPQYRGPTICLQFPLYTDTDKELWEIVHKYIYVHTIHFSVQGCILIHYVHTTSEHIVKLHSTTNVGHPIISKSLSVNPALLPLSQSHTYVVWWPCHVRYSHIIKKNMGNIHILNKWYVKISTSKVGWKSQSLVLLILYNS